MGRCRATGANTVQTDSTYPDPTGPGIASAMTEAEWLARIEESGERLGYFEALGESHFALFNDNSATLLVSFETMARIRADDDAALPLGHRIAVDNGWSSLTLIARTETWFRDPALFAFFDRLVDEAFFEDFDRVVFFGAGPGGYAAAAYSVAAPGATVILVAPQATLDPSLAGWDPRFAWMRRVSFTDRYGYAPDMVEGAGPVFLAHDPRVPLDAMHAALFARPFVTRLPCRGAGAGIATMLEQSGITAAVLRLAGEGRFGARAFWRLWRARRDHQPYLRGLVTALATQKRHWRAALVCRNVVGRMQAPRFAARLAQLDRLLAQDGRAPGRPGP